MTDLVKRLREKAFRAESCEMLETAADRIEKLEAALQEVLSLGQWGANALARTIILEALETTYDPLKEGAQARIQKLEAGLNKIREMSNASTLFTHKRNIEVIWEIVNETLEK
jgi:hypothetical protein